MIVIFVLQFHFCSGEASLATTTVSLLPIIEDNLANDMPSKIEGLFPLVAGSTSHDSEPSGQQQAQLGISVVFKIESDYKSTGRPTGRSPASVGRDETYHPEVCSIQFYIDCTSFYTKMISYSSH